MPKKPRRSLEEENIRLQRALRASNAENALLKRRRNEEKPKTRLIPRPDGQAGRSSGYNIQEAMCLKDDSKRFCRISRLIRSLTFRYLNPHKTIKKQDSTRVDKLIQLAMQKYPYLRQFQGGWAVRDLIKKVLQNSVSNFNKDEAAEALAARDDEDEDLPPQKKQKLSSHSKSDDSDCVSDDEVGSDDGGKGQDDSEEGSDDDEFSDADDESEEEEVVSKPAVKKANKKAAVPEIESVKTRVNNAKLKGKAKLLKDLEIPEGRNPSHPKSKPAEAIEATFKCPKRHCDELIPMGNLSKDLKKLLRKRQELVSTQGSPHKFNQLDVEICSQISWDRETTRLSDMGHARGWPVSLDLPELVTQTLAMESQLIDICTDTCLLENNLAWSDFLESIDGKLFEFGRTMVGRASCFEYADIHARCGYLGPVGSQLIGSTICRLLSKSFAEIKERLIQTIDFLVTSKPRDFDADSRKFQDEQVLPIADFIEYVLVPHVANHLIAQDMFVPIIEAINIKNDSQDFGERFHWWTEDPALVSLIELNDSIADEEAEHPVPLENCSPLREWSLKPSISSTPKHTRVSLPLPSVSRHSQLQFSPTEGRKKSANKQGFQQTIELTIDDFPPRGKKTQQKPKSKIATKKPKAVNEPEPEKVKKRKAKLAANEAAVDQAPRYTTRSSTRAAAVNGVED
ncbi:hypothetical protein B0H11DRAFT_2260756 [Mycena galericulata]|nr:hypothetical protein B0H11DRAFT_2260756 [Mycena galericulata]